MARNNTIGILVGGGIALVALWIVGPTLLSAIKNAFASINPPVAAPDSSIPSIPGGSLWDITGNYGNVTAPDLSSVLPQDNSFGSASDIATILGGPVALPSQG